LHTLQSLCNLRGTMYPLDNQRTPENSVDESTGSNPSSAAALTASAGESISPHIVIRGESNIHSNNHVALIDWFSFTLTYDYLNTTLEYLKKYLHNLFQIHPDSWYDTKKGWQGYETRINLGKSGFLAYGGATQQNTIHVSLTGYGCHLADDWETISILGDHEGWKIKRVDLAHDDFQGLIVNIPTAIDWFKQGLFTSKGRPPSVQYIDDFGTGKGKTFYIGNRKNGKLLRFYEKGKQLGDTKSPWCRVELELRSKDRIIPWDVLIKPGQYLAGSFDALSYLSIEQCKLKTIQKVSATNYESMVKWGRSATGKLINLMLKVEEGDLGAVVDRLRRDGYPKRLIDLHEYLPAAAVKELAQ